ncbi:class I histocompatibility antigen, F10 alpha chain-like isoform X2 [Hyperolius riggenbachi]|uniref:class I histocompatibility antigen, F10 alpha chain-like isoform X2 n=1 Tax=Hyperolius riggenbachi TaxID=752182 RepID=UPI0035A37055
MSPLNSHSLQYRRTAVLAPGFGLFFFSSMGYVDDKAITNYNSSTRQCLPMTEWVKKLDPESWERNTKINQGAEDVYRLRVEVLMSRFNQTGGIHIIQVMYGCDVRDDGSTAGYMQHGYDGRDLMYLDTQSGIWIPTAQEAQITTQRYNGPDVRAGEVYKYYLENECIRYLKQHIINGREDLEKRVPPEVKVWGCHQSNGVTRLQCLAYGFHPRAVDLKWVRNGEDHIPSDEASPILPHPDGTYQTRVSVEVPTREGDTYSCHVDHSSLEETLIVPWEHNNGLHRAVIAAAAICCLLVVTAVIGGVIVYKKRKAGYRSTNRGAVTSETGHLGPGRRCASDTSSSDSK